MEGENLDLDSLLALEDNYSNTNPSPQNQNNTGNQENQNNQGNQGVQDNTVNTNSNKGTQEAFDLIGEALKARGITDLNNIKIETELGIENKSFNDLTNEQKLEILNTAIDDDIILDQDEANIINFMRENELTSQDVINYYKNLGVQEYLQNNQTYKVDDLTDEELLALDLKTRYEDLTNEEILDEIERAKSNEALFNKKVSKIREEYKALEQQQLEEQNKSPEQLTAEEEANKEKFINAFNKVSDNYKTFSGMELEDSDLKNVYDYVFKPTLNGYSKLALDFNNPEKLYKMAFYMTHGDDVLQTLHTVYQSELNKKDKEISDLKKQINPNNTNTNVNKNSTVVNNINASDYYSEDSNLLTSLDN